MGNKCDCEFKIGESKKEEIDERIKNNGLSVILAIDKNFGIGMKGQMLFRIDDDLKRFKNFTMGKNLYMGRTTFESMGPLIGRKMIVLSKRNVKDADIIINEFDEFRERLKKDDNAFLIGGAKTVNSLIKDIKFMYITKVYNEYESDAKIFNPEENGFILDKISEEHFDDKTGLRYRFLEYVKKH